MTLDAELQRVAMENFGADQAGSAVVMDIVTGDLLVMASAPGFDPNQFVNGIGTAAYRALSEDEKKPLFHKSVSGAYAPGSTFKMMVGIAAKQAGVEDDWHVGCPGFFPFGGRNFHCWKRGGHGSCQSARRDQAFLRRVLLSGRLARWPRTHRRRGARVRLRHAL